jgi:hypothetical protein
MSSAPDALPLAREILSKNCNTKSDLFELMLVLSLSHRSGHFVSKASDLPALT